MKKIVSTFALALLVGGLTFAEDPAVKIGAWGRALFVPVVTGGQDGTDDINQSVLGVSWGGMPRVGITVSGSSEFVGFQADINADGGDISAGDQQKIWVKPLAGLTLQFGQAYDDTLRGNTAFGSWDWIRLGPISDEDNVFKRVDTQQGFEASFALDALYVYGAFTHLNNSGKNLNTDVAEGLQYGAGYTIKDIGLIRGQVVGYLKAAEDPATINVIEKHASYKVYEAAFRLTAVQNLYVDAGLKYPSDKDAAGYSTLINVYGNYTADKAKIHGLVTYSTPPSGSDSFMGIGAGLDYGLDDGLAFGTDVRYYSAKDAFGILDKSSLISFFAGLTKGFSNGLVGIGVQYVTSGSPSISNGAPLTITEKTAFGIENAESTGHFFLPIKAEYWF
jgi:hypothetical protein